MIQQLNLKLKCQQDDHQDEIDIVCYNQFCTEFRLNCFKCQKKGRIHQDHFDDVEKINSLIEFIENKNKECDNLIDDLNQQLESVNQSFCQLKMGIRQKYQLYQQKLVLLNSQQINDFLNSTIKFNEYKQSITTIIVEQTKKLTNSFNNLYQQLQLSSFNYYKNDDNCIKISEELYQKGYQLYMEDKYEQAIAILDKSIQQNLNNHNSLWCKGAYPKHVRSLCEKGECLRLMKKYNESLKFIDQALSIDQQHIPSLQTKGDCLRDQLKYKEALIYYEKSLKINPNNQYSKNQKNFCENKLKR
ncbi:unnamed protein product [Paramecium primaurelia]|uniref:Tetratricopeptide repeat protein n=1 Tax=Paramecium primaurelia TaxID=5886 RepID=A0A8S1QQ14_PARPR|nr:unnamed protein product [Paramecium primaurelia]